MEGSPKVAFPSGGRFQAGEVAQDLLLAAGHQVGPSLPCLRMSTQGAAEPGGHWAGRATFVFVIERESDAHRVTDARARGLANVAMQIEKEISVTDGHQIDAPRRIGLSVDLNAHRHRPAPIAHQPGRLIGADEHVGIYLVDFYPGPKAQGHRSSPLRPFGFAQGRTGFRKTATPPQALLGEGTRLHQRPANQSFGSAARTRASGRPSSRRTMLVPSTRATHL